MALAASLHSVPALAHAMLTKAQPPRRAQLTQPPPQVRLGLTKKWKRITLRSPYPMGTSLLPRQNQR